LFARTSPESATPRMQTRIGLGILLIHVRTAIEQDCKMSGRRFITAKWSTVRPLSG
jgi:hypothetical protein